MYILIKFMCLDPISCLLASALGPRWDLYVWSNIDFHFYKYLVHYENKSEWNKCILTWSLSMVVSTMGKAFMEAKKKNRTTKWYDYSGGIFSNCNSLLKNFLAYLYCILNH